MLKSNFRYLDLTFSKMASHKKIFHKYVARKIDKDMTEEITSKSMAIRLIIPYLDFFKPFDEQERKVKECLEKAIRLYDVLVKIDVDSMYEEIEDKNAKIKTLNDFREMTNEKGIIVNYDLGKTYRASKCTNELFADLVTYPYVQRYQNGVNPKTTLYMIKDNTLYKLKRLDPKNENSNYIIDYMVESVSEEFYKDDGFNKNIIKPTNVRIENLYEIITDKE